MPEHYEQILDIVAENPGSTVDEIEDLAPDHNIIDADIPGLLTEAVSNDDLLEFDDRHWVMRTGKYRYNRYNHPET